MIRERAVCSRMTGIHIIAQRVLALARLHEDIAAQCGSESQAAEFLRMAQACRRQAACASGCTHAGIKKATQMRSRVAFRDAVRGGLAWGASREQTMCPWVHSRTTIASDADLF